MIDRRSVLMFVAVAASVAGFAALAEAPREQTFDQSAYDATLKAGKPMLVEISATWCPTCKAQKVVLKSLLKEPRFADLTVFDVDFDARKDVVRALGAQRQSTMIVYAAGVEIDRAVGETDPEAIAALIASAY